MVRSRSFSSRPTTLPRSQRSLSAAAARDQLHEHPAPAPSAGPPACDQSARSLLCKLAKEVRVTGEDPFATVVDFRILGTTPRPRVLFGCRHFCLPSSSPLGSKGRLYSVDCYVLGLGRIG